LSVDRLTARCSAALAEVRAATVYVLSCRLLPGYRLRDLTAPYGAADWTGARTVRQL